VAAVGHHEQPAVGELAFELPGLPDRNEWIAIAADDHRRRVDSVKLGRGHQGLSRDIRGDRRQERPPRTKTLALVVAAAKEGRPRRIVAVGAERVHQPPGDRRSRLAGRRNPDHDEGPQPGTEAGRVLERRHRAHREAEEVECLEPEAVDERGEVVDEPVVAETRGRIPGRPTVTAGVRNVQLERLREQRDLRPEVLAPDRGRTVEHDERRARAVDVEADVQAVGADRRHGLVSPGAETNR